MWQSYVDIVVECAPQYTLVFDIFLDLIRIFQRAIEATTQADIFLLREWPLNLARRSSKKISADCTRSSIDQLSAHRFKPVSKTSHSN